MESPAQFIDSGSGVVGEKREALDDVSTSPAKRVRGDSDRSSFGDVKKVAEMVLVLAAMGKMRGGKRPTTTEKELMVEARNRLAKVCEGFAPKDVFPGDDFARMIEDLGLNKLKEQGMGFRPPTLSISEKLLVSKRKMEKKAEDCSLPSTTHLPLLQPNSSTAVESQGASHYARMFQPNKPTHMSINSGNLQPASPLVHSSAVNSSSLPYQLPTSEIRPIGSSSLSSSRSGSAALPRVDQPQLKSDVRANGSSHPTQFQGNYSANTTVRTPTWSVHQQSVLSSKNVSGNNIPANMPLKVERAGGLKSGMSHQMMSITVGAQTMGPPSQGTANHVQPPLAENTHVEIGKIVQKLLQRVSDRPTWNPPSRDYMNKPLTCQVCLSRVTDIDSILICDACEKGYHLKCLQMTNSKGVPRGEWHCGRCLSLSNGKPLPPKYGRVMRNVNAPKMSLTKVAVPSASIKQGGPLDENDGKPKAIGYENNEVDHAPARVDHRNHPSGSERKDSMGAQEIDNISGRDSMGDEGSSRTHPNGLKEHSSSATVSSVDSFVDKTSVEKVDASPKSSKEFVMIPDPSDKSTVESPPNPSLEKQSADLKESHGNESLDNAEQVKGQEVRDSPSEIATTAGAITHCGPALVGLHSVDWIGDPIQALDKKIYYASFSIKGYVYKAADYVLIRFDNGKLIPSKLQAMWEDINTSEKWVIVNQCYFPVDLPETVGRPCGLESSEVYESVSGRALLAGLIESPCEVLPPRRFAEESERRTRLGSQLNDHNLPPIYICKWIYDEVKGLFRDISC